MRAVIFLSVILFASGVMSQDRGKLSLPNAEEVERIEIGNSFKWYDAETLLKLLPQFNAASGTYGDKAIPFQFGKFILKNGKTIDWMANDRTSILLLDQTTGSRIEQLFVLPKPPKPDGSSFKVWDALGKDGFIDINGDRVPAPKESLIGHYSEGLAPIKVGNKFGYANEKSEIVIEPRWENNTRFQVNIAGPFSEGLAPVIEGFMTYASDDYDEYQAKCGYINTKGEYVIPPKYRLGCGPFSNGLALVNVSVHGDEWVKGEGTFGYMDTKGNWAIKQHFFSATSFKEGFALVQSEPYPNDLYVITGPGRNGRNNDERKSLYLIDTSDKRVENVKDCTWRYTYKEGLAYAFDEKNRAGFIDEKCRMVFLMPEGVKFSIYPAFSEGFLPVYKEIVGQKLYGYLDRNGKVVIDFQFASADRFSNGLAGVQSNVATLMSDGRKDTRTVNGYIDPQGKLVLTNTRSTSSFKNGLALQYLHAWTISERPNARNIYGYMNKQGKYVWLSPRAEAYLDKKWIKENYIGPDPTFRR